MGGDIGEMEWIVQQNRGMVYPSFSVPETEPFSLSYTALAFAEKLAKATG